MLTKKLLNICYLFNDSYSSLPTPVQRDEGDVSTSPNLAHTKLQKTKIQSTKANIERDHPWAGSELLYNQFFRTFLLL